jgi:hypothetical protein
VHEIVGTKVVSGDYWKTATVAEALLMQKSYARAGEVHQDAVASPLKRLRRTRPHGLKLAGS